MILATLYSILFAANIYTNADFKSVNTQVVHGDSMEVLEELTDSYRVRANGTDEGWVKKCDTLVWTSFPNKNVLVVDSLKAHIYRAPNVYEEVPIISLPYSSKLEFIEHGEGRWLKVCCLSKTGRLVGWIQEKDVVEELPDLDADNSVTFAERFMERPYTWGGLSSDGLDCSGLTKIVLQRRKIEAPHSASQQVKMGIEVKKEDLQRGDLIFFRRDGIIVHVGIYRGDGSFIHACAHETGRPAVRINRLDEPVWEELYATSRRVHF